MIPLSRRKGFSKTPLAAILAEADIGYLHLRSAGNPFRHSDDDVLALDAGHLASSPEIVDEVLVAATAKRSVLSVSSATTRSVIARCWPRHGCDVGATDMRRSRTCRTCAAGCEIDVDDRSRDP